MKYLYLIRHAKSSWKEAHLLQDIERPLNKRGKKAAPLMGEIMKTKDIVPDIMITSPAVRAQQTAKKMAKAMDFSKQSIYIRDEIYEAGTDDLWEVIRSLEHTWHTVFMFGHNPTYTSFANVFAQPYIENVPTCGIVGIEFNVANWKDASSENGSLKAFYYPKMFV